MKRYCCDFETATWLEDSTYVWAWALCEIGNLKNITINNNIDSFFEHIQNENSIIYFHNLKFDGEFIIHYLLKNGFKYIKDGEEKTSKSFTTLISDMGIFYSIEIYFELKDKKVKKTTIYDSLKILPFSVSDIAKGFGLNLSKLELDYNKPREINHNLTEEEINYIKNDVMIVAEALNILFKENLTKMTIGSNALANFKRTKGETKFFRLFPKLDRELYEELKLSYKGGFTYLNPIYKERENGTTIVLDVNSLYPSVMRNELMPYGDPKYGVGKYETDNSHPLYIQRITCSFELKKNKIPTIQLKKSKFFLENEYLTSSNGEIIPLTLTNIDLELFFEHYDVFDLTYWGYWKFKAMYGIFNDYIDYWVKVKNDATINKNPQKRTIAKLMLNSLYGKFATSMKTQEKIPYLENDVVLYKLDEEKEKEGLYIPIGSFITSYARNKTIRTSQSIKDYSIKKYNVDKYIYSDTDSIHTLLSIEELKQFCEIDDVELGKWKHEATATRSKFVRQKTYIEEIDNKIKITCAGMPKDCYKYVEWEKFKEGFTCGGKLTFKHVKGGVKLVETDFTIKRDKILKTNIKSF